MRFIKHLVIILFLVGLINCSDNKTLVETPVVTNSVMFYIGGVDGGFVDQDNVYASADKGVTWAEVGSGAFPTTVSFCQAKYFKGKVYVFGSSSGSQKVYSSADGINWTDHGAVLPQQFSEFDVVEYQDKLWVAGGFDGTSQVDKIFSSIDGVTWVDTGVSLNLPTGGVPSMAVFNNKIWIHGGQQSPGGTTDAVYSFDGTTILDSADLSVGDLPNPQTWAVSFVLGGSMFTAGGLVDDIYSTVDGVTWVDEKATNGKTIPAALWSFDGLVANDKAYLTGGFVAITPQTPVYESSNGVDWVKVGDLPLPRARGCVAEFKLTDAQIAALDL